MRLGPDEERLLVEKYSAADTAHNGVEAVLAGVKNQVSEPAQRRPNVMVLPAGNRDESMLVHVRLSSSSALLQDDLT